MKNEKKVELVEEFLERISITKSLMEGVRGNRKVRCIATALQQRMLKIISDNPEINAGQLAQKLDISSSSMAQLILRSEKLRIIERQTDLKDKRIVHLTVTKKGEKEWEMCYRQKIDRITKFAHFLPESDLKEIIRIHKDLQERMQRKVK